MSTLTSAQIWVVIPAHNEAATLRSTVSTGLAASRNIIVVNDGSDDGSAETLTDLPVTVLHNPTQQGKAYSLWRGFRLALAQGATGIITLDADGQHDPREIPAFERAHLRDPSALIIGVRARTRRYRHPWRYLANCLADSSLGWLAGVRFLDSQSGYRLYPAPLLQELGDHYQQIERAPLREGFVFESEVLLDAVRGGYSCSWIPLAASPATAVSRPSHFRPLTDSYRIGRRLIHRLLAGSPPAPALICDRRSRPTRGPQFRI